MVGEGGLIVRKLLVVVALCLSLVMAAVPARAITFGFPDGNRHPNVGALVGTFESGTFPYCSGTLISPRVFLTAAHCDISNETGTDSVKVTFDSEFTPQAKLISGTFVINPNFNQSQSDPGDIAVVIFDRNVRGLTPARLPTRRLLDQMKADGTLNQSTKFTSVGYGGDESTTEPGSGNVITFQDIRQFSVGSFNSLNTGFLRLSQNNAHGDGGTCFGDSGGPNFFGAGNTETNTIASTTITGDAFCKSTNVTYRLDIDSAREFLSRFTQFGVVVP
jgi:secreted trypsin-like serine protease